MGLDKGVMLHGELVDIFEYLCRAFKTLLDIVLFIDNLGVCVGLDRELGPFTPRCRFVGMKLRVDDGGPRLKCFLCVAHHR